MNGYNLVSVNFRDRVIRHSNFLAELTPISTDQDAADAAFFIRPGLIKPTVVSFESVNFPTFFLRHQDFRLKLQQNSGDDLFKNDASFIWRIGLSPQLPPSSGGVVTNTVPFSFESFNFPGLFIRHRDFHLFVENSSVNPDSFNMDATFVVTAAASAITPPR